MKKFVRKICGVRHKDGERRCVKTCGHRGKHRDGVIVWPRNRVPTKAVKTESC